MGSTLDLSDVIQPPKAVKNSNTNTVNKFLLKAANGFMRKHNRETQKDITGNVSQNPIDKG